MSEWSRYDSLLFPALQTAASPLLHQPSQLTKALLANKSSYLVCAALGNLYSLYWCQDEIKIHIIWALGFLFAFQISKVKYKQALSHYNYLI